MRSKITAAIVGAGISVTGILLWFLRPKRHERTIKGSLNTAQPDAIPTAAKYGERPLQLTHDGAGPLLFRRYRADIANPTIEKQALMDYMRGHIAEFSPAALADFDKVKGTSFDLKIGDEYDIAILGPWDGSVRVIDVKPLSFTFATLEGHPEAGEIRFEVSEHPVDTNAIRFEIMSWARSRDSVVHLAYYELGMGKEVQTNSWVTFCQRVAEYSGGTLMDDIDVITEERPYEGEVIPNG